MLNEAVSVRAKCHTPSGLVLLLLHLLHAWQLLDLPISDSASPRESPWLESATLTPGPLMLAWARLVLPSKEQQRAASIVKLLLGQSVWLPGQRFGQGHIPLQVMPCLHRHPLGRCLPRSAGVQRLQQAPRESPAHTAGRQPQQRASPCAQQPRPYSWLLGRRLRPQLQQQPGIRGRAQVVSRMHLEGKRHPQRQASPRAPQNLLTSTVLRARPRLRR